MAADSLPPGAYEAAAAAGPGAQDPLLAGLLAAAPLIEAAERERVRQLAVSVEAVYDPDGEGAGVPFADLLGAVIREEAAGAER